MANKIKSENIQIPLGELDLDHKVVDLQLNQQKLTPQQLKSIPIKQVGSLCPLVMWRQ